MCCNILKIFMMKNQEVSRECERCVAWPGWRWSPFNNSIN